jgi:hypothetical protein
MTIQRITSGQVSPKIMKKLVRFNVFKPSSRSRNQLVELIPFVLILQSEKLAATVCLKLTFLKG